MIPSVKDKLREVFFFERFGKESSTQQATGSVERNYVVGLFPTASHVKNTPACEYKFKSFGNIN